MTFHSFKKEILLYTLGLTFVTIVLTTAIGIFSTKTAGDDAADSTSAVLRAQAEELLIQITTASAQQQDLLFEQIRNDTENLAFYTGKIYENPSIFSGNGYWNFDTRVIRKNGLYVNNVADVSTFHIPSFVTLNRNKKTNIELTAALDFFVPSILDNNKNAAAMYTIDTGGVTRYFPNIVLGELGPPDYDPRTDIYYLPATPENNPQKAVIWSPLYDDAAGRGLMITATSPVYTKDSFAGIAATDVLLKSIIESIATYSPIEGSYVFLIDREGTTIAFPDKAYEDILGRPRAPKEGRTNLFDHVVSKDFRAALEDMRAGTTGFSVLSSGQKQHLFMAYAPLQQTGFSMGVVAEEKVILKAVGTLRGEISNSIRSTIMTLIFPASLFIIFAALGIGIFVANQVVGPVQKLTEGVREISKGNLNYHIKVRSRNEIGELASSFKQMSRTLKESRQKLYEYSQGLEEQVQDRTKELTVANSRLRQLDRMKSEFVSIASHQLRTPLTAIKGFVSLIQEGSGTEEDRKDWLKKLGISNERLVRLVEDLLNVSRIERGTLQYTFSESDFVQLIDDVATDFQFQAKAKNLSLVWERPTEDIPKLHIDSDKIIQVISNLIDNALKYTEKGSVVVRLIYLKDLAKIRLVVHDTGIGIPEEDIPNIFELFSRGERAQKTSSEGIGIGLYVARKVVEAHNGKIWAESEGLHKGSRFYVELPIR